MISQLKNIQFTNNQLNSNKNQDLLKYIQILSQLNNQNGFINQIPNKSNESENKNPLFLLEQLIKNTNNHNNLLNKFNNNNINNNLFNSQNQQNLDYISNLLNSNLMSNQNKNIIDMSQNNNNAQGLPNFNLVNLIKITFKISIL